MSIENNLKRIADALEKLTTFELEKVGPIMRLAFADEETTTDTSTEPAGETAASGGAKATRKTAAEKAEAAEKTKGSKVSDPDPEPEKKDEAPNTDLVTREDIQAALVDFCTNGPGKERAKLVFEEFKSGSISTLDTGDYSAFIKRLAVVAKEEA